MADKRAIVGGVALTITDPDYPLWDVRARHGLMLRRELRHCNQCGGPVTDDGQCMKVDTSLYVSSGYAAADNHRFCGDTECGVHPGDGCKWMRPCDCSPECGCDCPTTCGCLAKVVRV